MTHDSDDRQDGTPPGDREHPAAGAHGHAGLDGAVERLYDELHTLAERQLRRERAGHTLQPTALAHEAYVRLASERNTDWASRLAFLEAASAAVRRVLLDHARGRGTGKRGGDWTRVELGELADGSRRDVELVALDEALLALRALSPRQARLVELRFFGGLSRDEAAGVLAISARTADNDWRVARSWLRARLGAEGG